MRRKRAKLHLHFGDASEIRSSRKAADDPLT